MNPKNIYIVSFTELKVIIAVSPGGKWEIRSYLFYD